MSCAFSPGGQNAISGDQDRNAIVWDVGAVLTERVKRTRASCHGGAFSPDGTELASASGNVLVWNVKTGEHVQTLQGESKDFFYDCAWSPDGQRVAASSHNGMLSVWNRATGSKLFTARVSAENVGHVHCCAFSPDGSLLTAAAPWMISIFDTETFRLVRGIDYDAVGVGWCVFSADSRQVLDDQLQLWDISTGKRVAAFGDGSSRYSSVRDFSPDHSRALINLRRELVVMDVVTGNTLMSLPASGDGLLARYARHGTRIVMASSEGGELTVHDAASGQSIARFVAAGPIQGLVAGETHVACGTSDETYLLEMPRGD
jgi:WD40 repeat protein